MRIQALKFKFKLFTHLNSFGTTNQEVKLTHAIHANSQLSFIGITVLNKNQIQIANSVFQPSLKIQSRSFIFNAWFVAQHQQQKKEKHRRRTFHKIRVEPWAAPNKNCLELKKLRERTVHTFGFGEQQAARQARLIYFY